MYIENGEVVLTDDFNAFIIGSTFIEPFQTFYSGRNDLTGEMRKISKFEILGPIKALDVYEKNRILEYHMELIANDIVGSNRAKLVMQYFQYLEQLDKALEKFKLIRKI